MLWLPGGTFQMGSERFYPEEAPVRRVRVDGFWIDPLPVTNDCFARFVEATGYVTEAEQTPDPALYLGADPRALLPGSLVFQRPATPVPLDDPGLWWRFTPGAHWRQPLGPGSTVEGLDNHPVVHVSYADALAYARWAGKALPTEAEWEYAARGGLDGVEYAWGDEFAPDGAMLANTWQGAFPFANLLLDGWERTSPVGAYPPNGPGLFDMIGNVWEWTRDWFGSAAKPLKNCCVVTNPRGGREQESWDPANPARIGRRVLKGGSHLCAPNYCQRYRPAARLPQDGDSATSHIGFRCIRRTIA